MCIQACAHVEAKRHLLGIIIKLRGRFLLWRWMCAQHFSDFTNDSLWQKGVDYVGRQNYAGDQVYLDKKTKPVHLVPVLLLKGNMQEVTGCPNKALRNQNIIHGFMI